jgi:exopolyphosphatase / guanosine-5'-triphosphate,3'-diphosphate pyrophosphatase
MTQPHLPAPLAAIDMGTNTFHLLIVQPGKQPTDKPAILFKEKVSVKIGQGGISQGYIAHEAIERALHTLRYFRSVLDTHGVPPEQAKATATSAVRSAKNGPELIDKIKAETGIAVQVINGNQEAEYIYYGVKASLHIGPATSLIVDIGGGSVEFILCNEKRIFWKQSFEIGAQRLMDKFMQQDPIPSGAVRKLYQFLDDALMDLHNAIHQYQPQVLIGSSGSFDTLADIYTHSSGLSFDWNTQTEIELPLASFYDTHEQLLLLNRTHRLAIPGMLEMRVDMIVVASCLTEWILSRFGLKQIRVSTGSLKEGVLYKLQHGIA